MSSHFQVYGKRMAGVIDLNRQFPPRAASRRAATTVSEADR